MFDPSSIYVLPHAPYRTDEAGNVTNTLDGVFVLLDDGLIDSFEADGLTQAQKTELRSWVYRVDAEQAATWHVPVWAGSEGAVFLRIPASIWNDPNTRPPLKVRRFFRKRFREDT